MAKTVSQAFDEFMKNSVNLDKDIVEKARASRDNLLEEIAKFSDKNSFFALCSSFNYQFGSFARKTKCRPLDDIDLMIGIAGEGATYNGDDLWNNVRITPSSADVAQQECKDVNWIETKLNSTKVINRFIKELKRLPEYQHSEISKNGEAITLNLVSKEWSFDIVPCFVTAADNYGRDYYLIPNGQGNWKKTDPRIDRNRAVSIKKKFGNIAMDAIRLFKYWNIYANVITIPGYIAESLLLNYFDGIDGCSAYIDLLFRDIIQYVKNHIYDSIDDVKGLEGNINTLSYEEKRKLSEKSEKIYEKAQKAISAELIEKDVEKSINIWRDIFGSEFPLYG